MPPAKTAVAVLDGAGLRFRVTTGSGHSLVVDDAGGDRGPRPTELVLAALATCTGMDVASILRKKRQSVDRYAIDVRGQQRAGHPAALERIEVTHTVEGRSIDPEAVRRAIELSATRYCAVGATISSGAVEVRHRFRLLTDGPEIVDEVVVLGPNQRIEGGDQVSVPD